MARILVLHGPNLNLLGQREPDIYGRDTLEDINRRLHQAAVDAGHSLDCFQSNAEHEMVEHVQAAKRGETGSAVSAWASDAMPSLCLSMRSA